VLHHGAPGHGGSPGWGGSLASATSASAIRIAPIEGIPQPGQPGPESMMGLHLRAPTGEGRTDRGSRRDVMHQWPAGMVVAGVASVRGAATTFFFFAGRVTGATSTPARASTARPNAIAEESSR